MKEAAYYTSLENKKVRCELCPHHCLLTDKKRGICLTRQNIKGKLFSLNYCSPVSIAIDPIEKKPLYHFYPGTQIFSTGPNGCTFKCSFCQNCEISQDILHVREINPKSLVQQAVESNTTGIAYTYSEPYIWFETIMEIGTEIKKEGLKNVMVTNGYMEPAPLSDLLTIVDAMNIDIKSMRPEFYTRLCKGKLEPVLRTCETVKKSAHLEITNLIITDENDTEKDIRKLAQFISTNLGKDTPLHLSRYFPRYRKKNPMTPQKRIINAWDIAKEYLDYVFAGNMDTGDLSNTKCPSCSENLINRTGYSIKVNAELKKASSRATAPCPKCGYETGIVI